ncbi:MAG: methyltransferase, partial [Nitrospinae bacterium CG11_big_fil_rev_8_21_14_0_20_56_8]
MLSFNQIVETIDRLEEANILLAALEFRIFTHLGKERLSPRTVARRAGTHEEGTDLLLHALAAMGALKKRGDRFENTAETYRHFCATSPDYKKGTVRLRRENRDEWSSLIQIIRSGRDLDSFAGGDDPEFRRLFTYAMHERSLRFSGPVADCVAAKPVGRLLDLGGGPGSYTAAILKKDRKATATIFDRPAAIESARKILSPLSQFSRIRFRKGDIFDLDESEAYDTVLFSNILHIYNPKENRQLLRKIWRALAKGGRLVLVDLFLKGNRTEPYDAALFSLTMLLFTRTGKTYTFSETEKLLKAAGYGRLIRRAIGKGSS